MRSNTENSTPNEPQGMSSQYGPAFQLSPQEFKMMKTRLPDEVVRRAMTIESLEREVGIEPDVYLCDRIARINEALVARRDKPVAKKKGGAS